MTKKDLEIQELKMKIKKLEEQKKAALEYVEKRCTFDSHLQGFCMGLSAGEVKTLVLKMGGLDEYKKRNMERH